MNWEAIGAIGEILGAIAVFLSLVYLGLQIRAQNKEARASSIHEISTAYRSSMAQLQADNIAEIWFRGLRDYESLEASEKVKIMSVVMNILKTFEEGFYHYQQDRLDQYFWEGNVVQLQDFFGNPGVQHIWKLRKHQFGSEYQAYIDDLEPRDYVI